MLIAGSSLSGALVPSSLLSVMVGWTHAHLRSPSRPGGQHPPERLEFERQLPPDQGGPILFENSTFSPDEARNGPSDAWAQDLGLRES